MLILLDFDGTVVEHQYPAVGAYNEGCYEVVSALQNAGHEIILNTYRIELSTEAFDEAMQFLNNSGKIKKIEKYTAKKLHPEPWDLEKALQDGVLYLDDICQGIPLKCALHSNTQMVDWQKILIEIELV
jgi:hypothetical protein